MKLVLNSVQFNQFWIM